MGKNLNLVKLVSDEIADESSIRTAAERVRQVGGPVVVLVAPLGQTARTLVEAGQKSADQDLVLASALAEGLRTYHMQLAQQVTSPAIFRETRSLLSGLFEELSDLLKGLYLIGELSQPAVQAVGRYGERAAAIVLAGVLKSADLQAACFYTHEVFNEVDDLSQEIQQLAEKGIIAVLPVSLGASVAS